MRYHFLPTVMLLSAATLFAEEPGAATKAGEPESLTKAREKYVAKLKAATDPITADYLAYLDKLMKKFGADGDLESATKVREEIRKFSSPPLAAVAPKTLVGQWVYGEGVLEFMSDGTLRDADGKTLHGVWRNLEKRKFKLVWLRGAAAAGVTDFITLADDGDSLTVLSSRGSKFDGHRTK